MRDRSSISSAASLIALTVVVLVAASDAAADSPSGSVTGVPNGSETIEQIRQGTGAAPRLVASFDGLGYGFEGPQGTAQFRNPSDNSLAVGPNHIVQTVNSRMAIFTKKGNRYGVTGRVLYGPVETRNVFKDFGGPCEDINNGDAVVRYDQLADRWLVVMPIFRRLAPRENQPEVPTAAQPPHFSVMGNAGQPGPARVLYQPDAPSAESQQSNGKRYRDPNPREDGGFAMCYAISATADPMGAYYRYEFLRPLFPDYPRPAIWTDGYYVPTSTGDDVIEKHACVVERDKMLQGKPAKEQCVIINDVSFLNNADIDGHTLPPAGSPNIMIATGGSQLNDILEDDKLYAWSMDIDWNDAAKTRVVGPQEIPVAPYRFLCGGQLTNCVPQPGVEQRLDSQGDKIMSRFVYRRVGNVETLVAVHSVNTSAGGGGVRWYELRPGEKRNLRLHQQGTYAPGGNYRWMASPAIDRFGNIGFGYSFGGENDFPGQRFTGRLANDAPGEMTLQETALVQGEASQTTTLRWEDYSQTAIDPSDDCTVWYVGDYLKEGAPRYSSRIGAFQMGDCGESE